jgi:hypothetical protein
LQAFDIDKLEGFLLLELLLEQHRNQLVDDA